MAELLKLLRYFFKKTSGSIIICPSKPAPCNKNGQSWDAEKVANEIRNMKIKTLPKKDLKEAFEAARKTVDERHGLVVITGSSEIVADYWQYKGMKKVIAAS